MSNESNPGRELVMRRKRRASVCAECGKEIFGYTTKVYCGVNCRNRASRRRKKAQNTQSKSILEHFEDSLEENRELYRLLANMPAKHVEP